MASESLSQKSIQGNSRKGGTRRTWKQTEEQCLLDALKELVAEGWKCDNGFKNGFLNALEQAMAKKFPGCDLKGFHIFIPKCTCGKNSTVRCQRCFLVLDSGGIARVVQLMFQMTTYGMTM